MSVVIPVRNDPERVRQAAAAVAAQDYAAGRFEVVVVDNASRPASKADLRDLPVIHVDETSTITSYAARNRGIRLARGQVIAFTDADCIPDPHWISAGVDALVREGVQMVTGPIRYVLSPQHRAAEYIEPVYAVRVPDLVRTRGVAMTANLFVDRTVFEHLGLFPNNVKSGGDYYFTARATAAGYPLHFEPLAVVEHPARSFQQLMKRCYRIGVGKTQGRLRLPANGNGTWYSGAAKTPSDGNPLAPWYLQRLLRKAGHNVGTGKLAAIWWTYLAACLVTAVGNAAGALTVCGTDRRPRETDRKEAHCVD